MYTEILIKLHTDKFVSNIGNGPNAGNGFKFAKGMFFGFFSFYDLSKSFSIHCFFTSNIPSINMLFLGYIHDSCSLIVKFKLNDLCAHMLLSNVEGKV